MMRPNDYGNSFEDHLSPFAPATDASWETEEEQEDELWNESSEEEEVWNESSAEETERWDESYENELEWEVDRIGEYEAEPLGDPRQETLEWKEAGEEPESEWEDEALEERELDPVLVGLAERTIAREALGEELAPRSKWTTCFAAADITAVDQVYRDNSDAASAKTEDRCSCIVMLNVALAVLLPLSTKQHPARGTSTRRVTMAKLTTKTIEKAFAQLKNLDMAVGPKAMNFFDRRGRTAGTLKPERLKASVQDAILAKATPDCWSAFGFSIMDGYHSVLLLVDRTSNDPKIFWLDQFSTGVNDDVTTTLDQRVTDKTQGWWQGVKDTKNKGYRTTIRIWQLRKKR